MDQITTVGVDLAKDVIVVCAGNAAGAVVSGEVDKTTTMIDVWTFGREVRATSPIWYLYETRDEQAEDHKTPLPESR